MIPDILPPGMNVLFVGTVVTALSERLGFYHLHPRDRFWELLVIGGITPARIITAAEAKALDEGNRTGNLTDPVRTLFIEKKTGQLSRLGIGLTDLNRRCTSESEKDAEAQPTAEDVRDFLRNVEGAKPGILAFVTPAETFLRSFSGAFPGITDAIGQQPERIGGCETWFLGSTVSKPRGEALTRQEDTFFALGERIQELMGHTG